MNMKEARVQWLVWAENVWDQAFFRFGRFVFKLLRFNGIRFIFFNVPAAKGKFRSVTFVNLVTIVTSILICRSPEQLFFRGHVGA